MARLPTKALDLKSGSVNFARGKTGIDRRCPLRPETVAALQEAIASRPTADKPEHRHLAFLTRKGQPWGLTTQRTPREMVKVKRRDFSWKGF